MAEKKKKTILLIAICAVLAAVVIAAALTVMLYFEESSGGLREDVTVAFTVEEGSTFASIGASLEEKGIIGNKLFYAVYLKLNEPEKPLIAGKFELSPAMSYDEIITVVTGTPIPDVLTIRVIEGYKQDQILESLAAQTGYTAERLLDACDNVRNNYDFLKNLPDREKYYEGYLFPDTYEIFADESPESIMSRIFDNFDRKMRDNGIYEKVGKSKYSLDEIITLASIVQSESGSVDDMKDIAGVFANRLKINMKLESCVTVNYVTGVTGRSPTYEETEIDSRYNTYKYYGLPIGPVSNMRIEAVIAALEPNKHGYYFFVGAGGKTYFAKDIEGHRENIRKYLN